MIGCPTTGNPSPVVRLNTGSTGGGTVHPTFHVFQSQGAGAGYNIHPPALIITINKQSDGSQVYSEDTTGLSETTHQDGIYLMDGGAAGGSADQDMPNWVLDNTIAYTVSAEHYQFNNGQPVTVAIPIGYSGNTIPIPMGDHTSGGSGCGTSCGTNQYCDASNTCQTCPPSDPAPGSASCQAACTTGTCTDPSYPGCTFPGTKTTGSCCPADPTCGGTINTTCSTAHCSDSCGNTYAGAMTPPTALLSPSAFTAIIMNPITPYVIATDQLPITNVTLGTALPPNLVLSGTTISGVPNKLGGPFDLQFSVANKCGSSPLFDVQMSVNLPPPPTGFTGSATSDSSVQYNWTAPVAP